MVTKKLIMILFLLTRSLLCDNSTKNNTTTQNSTSEPKNAGPWINLYSVFLFRTGIYNPFIMVGNRDYYEIYHNRYNVSYDIFFNNVSEFLNSQITPGQNQTVINNISNVIKTNYLNDKVFPTNLSTTVFLSFDVIDYINYMKSVIDAATNSSSPSKIPNSFKMNLLKTGGYAGNSNTQIQYITIPDSQIIPSMGLRFFKTDVCPKFGEIVARYGKNPLLIDYYKKNFDDIITTWTEAFKTTLPYKCLYTAYDESNDSGIPTEIQNITLCAFNTTTDLFNPSKMVQAVDQFNFDYNVGLRDNLQPFYINGTRDRIQELKSFFLYELNTSSPIHSSILLEPLFDLFITVSNAFINDATDATSVNTRKVNFMVFEVGEVVFANINKMLKFGFYTNDTFFEHYKYLPRIVNGYHLSFELWTRNLTTSQEYQIRVRDYSTLMDKNYTLSEFSGILSEFMHNPILNPQERSYFCANTQQSS